ncbi:hypothetical protein N481_01265 [Pseudoalteromonas luteoviolacea S4047-1]|uniref:Uncharacterized protein n=1 Tax=Pseudoalteromonas luteoviolacea S4054 TaxID=1129367 RepID=A0A0F6AFM4_9GAMM|nr:hypothetical protein N479_06155 [Pseudoalteromonas luteoviolacea S4054]KZN70130.1 hypothetical protein N481_01265 [Pseudoalteromonas luteoviolacea S4047-1]
MQACKNELIQKSVAKIATKRRRVFFIRHQKEWMIFVGFFAINPTLSDQKK